ncbi:MAG: tetratricopeptide repeat protein [Candidatus Tenebribacter davisii]|nr:tetratricopeptide repeat protein [Candidatus Tenebribacter davisii]
MEILTLIAAALANFGFNKIIEKGYVSLFTNKKDFEKRLYNVINKTVDEYKIENSIEHNVGQCPFYDSKELLNTLLKYRFYNDNKKLGTDKVIITLRENQNLIKPSIEEVEYFLTLLENHLEEDVKLKELFCFENAPIEIFIISENVKKQFDLLLIMDEKLDILIKRDIQENKSDKFLTNPLMQDLYVVGRDKDLKNIKDKLESDKSLLLMNGLGGIGKTTLAKKYILEYEGDFDHIIWLEISHGVKEAFFADGVLHNNLNLTEKIKNMKPEDAFPFIMNILKNMDGNNLMVLDDAKGDFGNIRRKLPGKPNWKLLITSRQEFTGIETYHLDFLKPEDALKLFYEYYTSEKDDELLEKIFKPVRYHTLVVELFAKMAMMNGLTLGELTTKANAEGITISISTDVDVDHSKENIENILEYLMRTFPANELTQELIIILRKLAIMPSGFYNIKVLDLLLHIEEEKKEEFHLNLNKLIKLGWLEEAEREYKMHEIIRQLVLKEYPPDYEFYEDYISFLRNISIIDQSKDNPVEKFFIIPFCLNVIENIQSNNEEMGYLMKNAASLLSDQGKYSEALEINIIALDIAKKIGNKKLELNIMTNLGSDYENLGKYKEARDYMEQVLSVAGEIFGDNHQNIASMQSNLAIVYGSLGEYTKARELLELALKSAIENFGEKHPTVAVSQSNLANVYLSLGEYAKARDLLKLALKSDIENFGEKHPNVAVDQSNLANVYGSLGEYTQARDLLALALKSARENFGEKHPNVAVDQSNLANVYGSLGEYTQARDLLALALKSAIENFGEKHPNVAAHQSNLALVYISLGEFAKARDLLVLALKSDMDNFGEKHPNVATRYNNLGGLYLEAKEYDLAWNHFHKALSISKIVWGEEHPNTITIKNSIEYLIKLMTSKVLAGNGTEVSNALSSINESLPSEVVEMKQYFEFLNIIIKKGDDKDYFEKLSPGYKQMVIEVQNDMQQEAFWEELNKYTVMSIQTHNNQENLLEEMRLHISKLGENIHPEVRKYYGFLLEYAEGKDADELKDTIDQSLWEMFIEIRDGRES